MVFIIPGLANDSQQIWGINIAKECQMRGFDSCFINYRGLADCELTTPKWYSAASVQDFIEPMHYVIK
jgi:predicted alpha/beta-fold hydrolase